MKNAIYLLFPLTALLWIPTAFEEFEQSKIIPFITFACFAAFLVDWRRIFTDKIAFWLFIFTISAGVSTYLSIDWHMSFFGNIKCRNGFVVTASYLVFYLAAAETLVDRTSITKAIDIILVCSALVAVYAIFQFFGYDVKQWSGTMVERGYTRPMSFLGHPNFMANYLGMTLPFAIWRMTTRSVPWIKFVCGLLILISTFSIWVSLSRGMLIAAIAGVLVYLFISGLKLKTALKCIAAISVFILSSLLISDGFRQTAVDRAENITALGPARQEYPAAAVRIWKRYPWFGIGTDAYEVGFAHQRTPYYWQIEFNKRPHRAHNDFLNVLATQGIFGALAVIFLTLNLGIRALQTRSRYRVPAIASLTVFYVAGLSSFYIVATGVLFIFCAVILRWDESHYQIH